MKAILRTLMALLLLTVASTASGASRPATRTLTADSVFIRLPHTVLELLHPSIRMDMIDYYHLDSIYRAENLLDGRSWLDSLTADYLKVHLTDVSWLEIKILPLKKGGDVAAVSYTVDSTGAQADSQLFMLDADMNPLPVDKFFRTPRVKDFLHIEKGSVTKEKELVQMVEFPTIEYTFSPDNSDLTARLTVGEYMDVDDFNIFRLFLLPKLRYVWNGTRFEAAR